MREPPRGEDGSTGGNVCGTVAGGRGCIGGGYTGGLSCGSNGEGAEGAILIYAGLPSETNTKTRIRYEEHW